MTERLLREWDDLNKVPKITWHSDSPPDSLPDYSAHLEVQSSDALPLRMLYTPSSSKTLIVSLHGALNRGRFKLPRFEWRRTLSRTDCAQLYLSDSTLELSRSIQIGWYIGTAQQDLIAEYATLVRSISIAGDYTRVVCIGSSAGGFGALALSRKLPNSVAVVFSPQTTIAGYSQTHRKALAAVSFQGYKSFDAIENDFSDRVNMRMLYKTSEDKNYVHYVQNTRDRFHFEAHYAPFALSFGVDPERGGFAVGRKISFHPEQQEEGHAPPSRSRLLKHVQSAHRDYYGVGLRIHDPNTAREETLGRL